MIQRQSVWWVSGLKNKSRVSDREQNEAIVSNYHIVPDDSTNL